MSYNIFIEAKDYYKQNQMKKDMLENTGFVYPKNFTNNWVEDFTTITGFDFAQKDSIFSSKNLIYKWLATSKNYIKALDNAEQDFLNAVKKLVSWLEIACKYNVTVIVDTLTFENYDYTTPKNDNNHVIFEQNLDEQTYLKTDNVAVSPIINATPETNLQINIDSAEDFSNPNSKNTNNIGDIIIPKIEENYVNENLVDNIHSSLVNNIESEIIANKNDNSKEIPTNIDKTSGIAVNHGNNCVDTPTDYKLNNVANSDNDRDSITLPSGIADKHVEESSEKEILSINTNKNHYEQTYDQENANQAVNDAEDTNKVINSGKRDETLPDDIETQTHNFEIYFNKENLPDDLQNLEFNINHPIM